jgi:predicted secreted hydrolase
VTRLPVGLFDDVKLRAGGVAMIVALMVGLTAAPARAATASPAAPSAQGCAATSGGAALAHSGTAVSSPLDEGSGVRLPQDEAAHADPNEWWYFSGHLSGIDAAGHQHCYGYEFVIFQFLGIAPSPVYFGNLSVSDLSRGSFHYGVEEDSYPVPTTRDGFSLHTGAWTMVGGSGRDVLHADLPGYTLNLQLRTTERPVLEGDNGTIPFGPFGTSKYYSWTSLLTAGTIIDHGVTVEVSGQSWMDHQWGAFNFASGAGWDWFSIQLSDGQQYMLYLIRDETGKIVHTIATRVNSTGHSTQLDPSSFSEQATGSWLSPTTGITYSSGWRLTLPGGHLVITPDLVDQELDLRETQGVAYWEGDVSVRGRINGKLVTGVGYTEINPPSAP